MNTNLFYVSILALTMLISCTNSTNKGNESVAELEAKLAKAKLAEATNTDPNGVASDYSSDEEDGDPYYENYYNTSDKSSLQVKNNDWEACTKAQVKSVFGSHTNFIDGTVFLGNSRKFPNGILYSKELEELVVMLGEVAYGVNNVYYYRSNYLLKIWDHKSESYMLVNIARKDKGLALEDVRPLVIKDNTKKLVTKWLGLGLAFVDPREIIGQNYYSESQITQLIQLLPCM